MLDNPKLIFPISVLFEMRLKTPHSTKSDTKKKLKIQMANKLRKNDQTQKQKEIQFKTIVWAITLAKTLNINKIHFFS